MAPERAGVTRATTPAVRDSPDADSEYDVFYIYPERAQWNKTRGAFICIVYSLDGPTLTGSVRGSNR